ncbi:MAG: hypothetical protein J6Y64_00475 [Ruminococcus sp.]|nr:hypothetical protein [Ruminococcus sp.]
MRPIISIDNGNTDSDIRYPIIPNTEPIKCVITRSDLYSDATGLSAETGKLMQYPVRMGLYAIELEYLGSDSEIADIERLINGAQLTVNFIHNGVQVEAVMYPSDRVNETEIILNNEGRHRLSFSLIEI